jgi:ketosteroid isomerase-like protein
MPSSTAPGAHPDLEVLRRLIDDSIGWARTKDFALLHRIFRDEELFIFHPEAADTVTSLAEFRAMGEKVWANHSFRAIRHEIRDLRLRIAESGTVAWFSCHLDDLAEWDGRPVGWQNVRWTGVLEKRRDGWTVVQMHFSFPTDQRTPETKPW